jgi:drug/metabolite transporter (DMT)-like permease
MGPLVWAALGVDYIVGGSTYLAIRFSIETLPPLVQAALRFVLAGVILLGAVLLRSRRATGRRGGGRRRASRGELVTAAASGVLLLTTGNGLLSIGEERVPSGITALIAASVPLWIVVLRIGLRDRPSIVTTLGVLVGFGGVALLFRLGGGTDVRYALLIVLGSLSWAVGSLLVARRSLPADPLVLSAVQMLAGGAALVGFAGARGEFAGFSLGQVSLKSWLALAYLVVFGSLLVFTVFVWLLRQAPVTVVSMYAYVNPVIAVLLGVAFADEHLTRPAVVGGLLILISVALVVTAEGRARRAADALLPAEPATAVADPQAV